MTHEDYVSFEQAKALKELGFDWKCSHFYEPDNEVLMPIEEIISSMEGHDFRISVDTLVEDSNKQQGIYSAPTLSQVQKWIREMLGIEVYVLKDDQKYCYEVEEDHYPLYFHSTSRSGFETYEQALSAGIDKALDAYKNGFDD